MLNLKIYVLYCSSMSFHSKSYQETVILKYYILQRSKVLYQLHFNQIYHHVILNLVIYKQSLFYSNTFAMYLWIGSWKRCWLTVNYRCLSRSWKYWQIMANNQDKQNWLYGTKWTKGNCYSYDFVQDIANFKSLFSR